MDKEERPAESPHARRFALVAALLAAFVAILPYLYALATAPNGSAYLGGQFSTDDQMVYAAWMRQAQDGRFLLDNRFTTDPQPGLTSHLYYLLLGLISKFTGIGLAMALARALFSGLFTWLLYRLVSRVDLDPFFAKLAIPITLFGGGIGFTVWHNFGSAFVPPEPGFVFGAMSGSLPTDVWQPEGFVFPSMLTNDLFAVSLCLILGVLISLLDCRTGWRPVPIGACCSLVLMNIHSYDVLILGMVMLAFAVASVVSRTFSAGWALRALAVFAGAIPSALWFAHVLQNDPVFRARAATETFAPNFRSIVFGYLLPIALAIAGSIAARAEGARKARVGAALAIGGIAAMFALAEVPEHAFWMGWPAFLAAYLGAVAVAALWSTPEPAKNLLRCWALAGLVIVYLPQLFQRKLAMGLAIPWAILAALALFEWLRNQEKGVRNMAGALGILGLCGSAPLWLQREFHYIRANVARTTVHPVYLSPDARRIVDRLNEIPGRKSLLAMPGVPIGTGPDDFASPYVADLNAIASGLTGAYSFAGHWSETPDYLLRRAASLEMFLRKTPEESRSAFLRRNGVTHVVAPVPEAFPEFYAATGQTLADLRSLGTVLVDGTQFRLIEFRADPIAP